MKLGCCVVTYFLKIFVFLSHLRHIFALHTEILSVCDHYCWNPTCLCIVGCMLGF